MARRIKVVQRCSNCARLERELHQLREELAELRRQVNRNAANSSMPPASNPPWAPRPVVKKPTGNKPGGQVGHEGHHRSLLAPQEVDEVIRHTPSRCPRCGLSFDPGALEQGRVAHRHQVMELPWRAVKVIEHQSILCRCSRCGERAKEPIPSPVLASVCGERLSAAITFVSSRVHGSRRSIGELLGEMLGAPLSLGTILARESEMSHALDRPYREARTAVQRASAKNIDETGWKRAGRYLWLAATRTLAVFHVDPCRNRDAMNQLLGEKPLGMICSDRFGVYEKIPLKQRSICWAHLKRDFQGFVDAGEQSPGTAASVASKQFGRLALAGVKRVMELWHRFRSRQIARSTLQRRLAAIRREIRELLNQHLSSPVKRIGTFCRSLLKLEPALWAFGRVEGIEPTNNHAERMLRPAVCWRKTSLGSHSLGGCRFVERMLTVVQTLSLRGQSVIDYLTRALHAWRTGEPVPSLA